MGHSCALIVNRDGSYRTVLVKDEGKGVEDMVQNTETGLKLTPVETELQLEALRTQLDSLESQRDAIDEKIDNVKALLKKVTQSE